MSLRFFLTNLHGNFNYLKGASALLNVGVNVKLKLAFCFLYDINVNFRRFGIKFQMTLYIP